MPRVSCLVVGCWPLAGAHERLYLEWIREKPGYLYINVSHDAPENVDVYFDDLTIEHTYSPVVAGNDFYPFGLAMEDRQITREKYRYGYQGQYAEKDEETGWNHFELRNYDPVIGRWFSTDPYNQFASPYLGMGNNPINGVDPDGGLFEDYLLDSKGNLTLIAETNEADRVYSTNGTDFVQLEYDGQIADMKSGNFNGTNFDYIKFSNNQISKDFFEFVSKNSMVEWSQVSFGTISSYVSTGHKPHSEPGGAKLLYDLTVGKYTVRSHVHSHPTSTSGPSGFDPSHKKTGDKDFTNWVHKYNPNVKLQVYEVKTNTYIKYNHTGVIK